MNTKSNILILMLITACTLFSCIMPVDDDEEPTLPPATMEGKNTFGCKVNGKVWVPSVQTLGVKRLQILFEKDDLQIQARLESKNDLTDSFLSVDAIDVIQVGTYMIPLHPFNGKMYRLTNLSTDCKHRVTPENSKIVITKLDKSARIISGTFEYMNMINPCDSLDIINITEGRFDMKF